MHPQIRLTVSILKNMMTEFGEAGFWLWTIFGLSYGVFRVLAPRAFGLSSRPLMICTQLALFLNLPDISLHVRVGGERICAISSLGGGRFHGVDVNQPRLELIYPARSQPVKSFLHVR